MTHTIAASSGQESLSLAIGMTSLGCIDDSGAATCKHKAAGSCNGKKASDCLRFALESHPESRRESVLAYISVISAGAKSIADVEKAVERAVSIL